MLALVCRSLRVIRALGVTRGIAVILGRLRLLIVAHPGCTCRTSSTLAESRQRQHYIDPYVELCTPAALSLFDVPPSLGTEGHFIKELFVIVAAPLLGSRRRHRVLWMRLFFVPQWGGSHLIC